MAGVEQVMLGIASGLLTGSLHGAIVIAVVWLVCWQAPSIPASVRALIWWLASLKLVLALLPLPALSVPLLAEMQRQLAAAAERLREAHRALTTGAAEPQK